MSNGSDCWLAMFCRPDGSWMEYGTPRPRRQVSPNTVARFEGALAMVVLAADFLCSTPFTEPFLRSLCG